MTLPAHPFSLLFSQLGLPADDLSIRNFIDTHRPLANDLALADAPFWNVAQAQFLRESLGADAEWAEVVDQLNVALRAF